MKDLCLFRSMSALNKSSVNKSSVNKSSVNKSSVNKSSVNKSTAMLRITKSTEMLSIK